MMVLLRTASRLLATGSCWHDKCIAGLQSSGICGCDCGNEGAVAVHLAVQRYFVGQPSFFVFGDLFGCWRAKGKPYSSSEHSQEHIDNKYGLARSGASTGSIRRGKVAVEAMRWYT